MRDKPAALFYGKTSMTAVAVGRIMVVDASRITVNIFGIVSVISNINIYASVMAV